jgi:hypothetical protein
LPVTKLAKDFTAETRRKRRDSQRLSSFLGVSAVKNSNWQLGLFKEQEFGKLNINANQ